MENIEKMNFIDSLLVSLNGFSIVFMVLIALMLFLMILSHAVKFFDKKHKDDAVEVASEAAPVAVEEPTVVVNTTAGQLQLLNVDERTAAMIMAIVSEQSQIPLNELVFKSIKALES